MNTAILRAAIIALFSVLLAALANPIFDTGIMATFTVGPLVVIGVVATASAPIVVRVGAAMVWNAAVVVGCTWWATGNLIAPLSIDGPRRMLTTEWPSPLDATVYATVIAALAIAVTSATALAMARRWYLLPLLVLVIPAVGFTALSAPADFSLLPLTAAAVLVVGFALASHERVTVKMTLVAQPIVWVAVFAFGLTVIAVGTVAAPPVDERADPRQLDKPLTVAPLLDPIEATLALHDAEPAFKLFDIDNVESDVGSSRRGLPLVWRTSAADEYDGKRWSPTVALRPIGGRLESSTDGQALQPVTYVVTLQSSVELLPLPGTPLTVSADVETDLARTVVRPLGPILPGQSFEVTSTVQHDSSVAAAATYTQVPASDFDSVFAEVAQQLGGAGSDGERLLAIEQAMRDDWKLDPEAGGAGQQLALVERFVNETRRGTREQFVTAFVLLARSLGVQARVASGFVVEPDTVGDRIDIDSRHAAIWAEVSTDEFGWIRFDPVPTAAAKDQPTVSVPPQAQAPAAVQPPVEQPPDQPTDDDPPPPVDEQQSSRWAGIIRWVVRVGLVAVIGLGPIIGVLGGIIAIKWRRRHHRMATADPIAKVRGAWANATDDLIDAGMTISRSSTDNQIAEIGRPYVGTADHEIVRLATMSSAATFGPTDKTLPFVDDAVATSHVIGRAIKSSMSRRERLQWYLSLRSLRPKTRSPVTP